MSARVFRGEYGIGGSLGCAFRPPTSCETRIWYNLRQMTTEERIAARADSEEEISHA